MTGDFLSQEQERFCLLYVEGNSPAESWMKATGKTDNAKRTASASASQWLAMGRIQARIEQLRKKAEERTLVRQADVLQEVARLGLADVRKLFREDGSLKPIHELDGDAAAMIASIEVEEIDVAGETVGRLKKVKLWDKNSALDKLMKHLGMYEKDNQQKAGLFDNLPPETKLLMLEKLRALYRPDLARQPAGGSPSRTTH